MTDPSRVQVVGIGNPDRGDDGFGSTVARSLRGPVPPEVIILERRGDILALIDDWNSFSTVIIVDAMASIGEPGRIHRFELIAGPPCQCDDTRREFVVNATARRTKRLMATGGSGCAVPPTIMIDYAALRAYRVVL